MHNATITSSDGLQLNCRQWLCGGSEKHIVILHSLGEHAGLYSKHAKHWQSKGYNVHVPDMRGHGNSEGIRGHTPSWQHLIDDLHAWCQQIKGTRFVVAHATGCITAALYSLQQPNAFVRAAFSAPSTRLPRSLKPRQRLAAKVFGTLTPTRLLTTHIKAKHLSKLPEFHESYQADPLVHKKISLRFFREYLAATHRLDQSIQRYTTPTAIWHGADDPIVEAQFSEDLYQVLHCKPKRRYEMPKLKHSVLQEDQGEIVAQCMLEWLDN